MAKQGQDAVAEQVGGGVLAGEQQVADGLDQFVVGQVPVRAGDQRADQALGACARSRA
ncbi:hypothetical protein EV192_111124 [Actinocrispum wychmicini]|uniref:Uncharacterized protein n=2 Tax=Actinocrispum wychmicini TaxID=1213861 RepID=A0A4V2S5P9_9PSEU|nr:hypothetical protein EV192_111124 [Actinocrispum wychmicini]